MLHEICSFDYDLNTIRLIENLFCSNGHSLRKLSLIENKDNLIQRQTIFGEKSNFRRSIFFFTKIVKFLKEKNKFLKYQIYDGYL